MVISFIVEAFVLQLEQSNRRKEKKILERQIVVQKPVDDTDCVEGTCIIYMYRHYSGQYHSLTVSVCR